MKTIKLLFIFVFFVLVNHELRTNCLSCLRNCCLWSWLCHASEQEDDKAALLASNTVQDNTENRQLPQHFLSRSSTQIFDGNIPVWSNSSEITSLEGIAVRQRQQVDEDSLKGDSGSTRRSSVSTQPEDPFLCSLQDTSSTLKRDDSFDE